LQGFGDALIFVVKNRRKRSEQMSRKNSSLVFWQVERELLYFSDGNHASTLTK